MNDPCNCCKQKKLEYLYTAPAFDSLPQDQKKQTFKLARCRSCGLVNTLGVKPDEVAEAYTPEYYGSASSKFVSIIERILAVATIIRARKITRLWQKGRQAEKSPSVLDIGCGRGQLLHAFKSIGASVLGLERQEFPGEKTPGDIVRVGSIGDPEYADRQFDIIILWHVLEHLVEQERLLDEITKHLNENGLLIIAVPNFSSLQQRFFSKYWFHLDLPRHLVHFESKCLMDYLAHRGYTKESVNYMDPIQNIFGFIQSALNAIAPGRQNEYYRLLKHGRYMDRKNFFPLLKWSALSIALLPFALLENIFSTLLHSGATVQVIAKLERKA